jgi:hypothetical protein
MRGPTRVATGVSNTKDSFCTNKTRQRTAGSKSTTGTGTSIPRDEETNKKVEEHSCCRSSYRTVSLEENANVSKIYQTNVIATAKRCFNFRRIIMGLGFRDEILVTMACREFYQAQQLARRRCKDRTCLSAVFIIKE